MAIGQQPRETRFLNSFNRINLTYQVLPKKGKKVTDEVAELIKVKYKNQSGIVYCFSRKECDTVAADLSRCGIMAKSYHAGLADNQRSNIQNQWINDKVKRLRILHFISFTGNPP
ncbi:Bloom syndrome [Portunus trituberculatus]|uniref:Bloom syndrome n=1 Tax=Portunus trituberculatus TaxID=210409 RepID=A0A5B7F045_PORTR|nr:Bloom syndrome [Portunus trituberculatus]